MKKHFFTAIVLTAILSSTALQASVVIAWGYNGSFQCNVPYPNTGFVAVAAGYSHSLGLKSDGSIVAWGWNGNGECNVPLPNTGFVAVAAGGYHSLALKTDGWIVAWGDNDHGQCNVPDTLRNPNRDFVAVAAGEYHSLGLKSNGSIVGWGYNSSGQCDAPSPNTDFVAVAAGEYHSLGLKSNGSIVAWGYNNCGQCDVPDPNTGFVAVAAGWYHSLGLKSDGSIVAWGDNGFGKCTVPEPNTGFLAVAAGAHHSLGLKSDGSLVAWGDNWAGRCNVPDPNTGFVAVAAGGLHSLGLKSEFTLSISKTGNGSVKVNGTLRSLPWSEMFATGTNVTLEAIADSGWQFSNWSGNLSGSTNPTLIQMDGAKTVTANYVLDTVPVTYTLSLSKTGNGSIIVNGTLHPLPWSEVFTTGTTVTLEAVADNGWQFSNWSGDLSGSTNPTSIQMDGAKTVTANYVLDTEPVTYTLSLSKTGNGSVIVNGTLHPLPWSEMFTTGTTVTLEAVADSNWQFSHWSGDLSESTNPTSIQIDGDKSVTAKFTSSTPPCKFGSFDSQKNVKQTLQDCSYNDVTFSLSGPGYGEIDCEDCNFSLIALYNTTEKSGFTIKTRGKTETSVGDIIVNGSLKGIMAKTSDLRGDITVNGSLGSLTFDDIADGHAITIGPSANPKAGVLMKFDEVSDLTIDSDMPIKTLLATEWVSGSIDAPSVGSITIKGDKKREISGDLVDVDLILSRKPDAKIPTLGKLTVKGWIDSSRILSEGNIGTVMAGGVIDSSCFAGVTTTRDVNAADGVLDLPDPAVDINYVDQAAIKSIKISGIKDEPCCFINSNIAAAQILSACLAYPKIDNSGVVFGIAADYIKALKVKDAEGIESWKNLDEPSDSLTSDDAEIRLY